MPIKNQVTSIQGCKDIILRREVKALKHYLTDLLVKSGEIKPTFSMEDVRLNHTDKFVINFSDDLKKIVRDRLGNGYLRVGIALSYIRHLITHRYLDRDKFISDISKILDSDVANQYCDILIGIIKNQIEGNTETYTDIATFNSVLFDDYVCNLYNMIDIMTVLLVQCFEVKDISSWSTTGGYKSLDNVVNNMIFINSNNVLSVTDIARTKLGLLSTLDDNTKTNIIGSIWNCIIDILKEVSINDTLLEEGGVVNG